MVLRKNLHPAEKKVRTCGLHKKRLHTDTHCSLHLCVRVDPPEEFVGALVGSLVGAFVGAFVSVASETEQEPETQYGLSRWQS